MKTGKQIQLPKKLKRWKSQGVFHRISAFYAILYQNHL